MSVIPKVIYFTYKVNPPLNVLRRWEKLNPNYKIDFNLDSDCISFLNDNFSKDIADLFIQIPKGMFKADLWRICKLYISGGVYADIDLVPYVSIDDIIKDNYYFYSCLCAGKGGIFQAFIITTPKNPLLLQFIHSFIRNKPWLHDNGPTHDMYDCIKYNLCNNINITSDTLYNINTVKIHMNIGNSSTNVKEINLYNFSQQHKYTFFSSSNNNNEFTFEIIDNKLIVTNNINSGWTENISIDICIKSNQTIYLFEEHNVNDNFIVSFKGKKILDSRDARYDRNKTFTSTIHEKRFEYLMKT